MIIANLLSMQAENSSSRQLFLSSDYLFNMFLFISCIAYLRIYIYIYMGEVNIYIYIYIYIYIC